MDFQLREIMHGTGTVTKENFFDYHVCIDEDPIITSQLARNNERADFYRALSSQFSQPPYRLTSLFNVAKRIFNNGYQKLDPGKQNQILSRIDSILCRIVDKSGLTGPRAQELKDDYRMEIMGLVKAADQKKKKKLLN